MTIEEQVLNLKIGKQFRVKNKKEREQVYDAVKVFAAAKLIKFRVTTDTISTGFIISRIDD